MSRKQSLLRRLIGIFLALAFVIAAEPGTMAMPARAPASVSGAHLGMPGCDHQLPLKDKGASHKNLAFCPGMLACFGMAAVAVDYPPAVHFASFAPAPHFERAAPGLTHPPENPPPIA